MDELFNKSEDWNMEKTLKELIDAAEEEEKLGRQSRETQMRNSKFGFGALLFGKVLSVFNFIVYMSVLLEAAKAYN